MRIESQSRTIGVAMTIVAMACAVSPAGAQSADSVATATLSDSGITVRFPRFLSPDSITREMSVGDLFSGYEWRVILLGADQSLLSALVVAPNDSLVLHRYASIRAVYDAGDLRQCHREDLVLECDRLARGLVRDVSGRLEIGILDSRWLLMALQQQKPVVRLAVKRNRDILWTADIPLAVHLQPTAHSEKPPS